MRIIKVAIIAIAVMQAAAATVLADRRSFVWTYEYATMPAGIAELEYYLTATVPDTDAREVSAWQHQFEIEYGISDNWDVSLYQAFDQVYGPESSSDFKYSGFKLRTRYKLFKAGEYMVDPLLYAEYIRAADFAEPDVLEGKLVLARMFDKVGVAYNVILEGELGGDEVEHKYAAGIKYDVTPDISVGIESKGNWSEDKFAIGPVVSGYLGESWVSFGVAVGLNDLTDDVQARLLAGFSL